MKEIWHWDWKTLKEIWGTETMKDTWQGPCPQREHSFSRAATCKQFSQYGQYYNRLIAATMSTQRELSAEALWRRQAGAGHWEVWNSLPQRHWYAGRSWQRLSACCPGSGEFAQPGCSGLGGEQAVEMRLQSERDRDLVWDSPVCSGRKLVFYLQVVGNKWRK